MKCACGCGIELSAYKVKKGNRFLNRKHANRWKGLQRKGTKIGPYKKTEQDVDSRDVDYSLGKKYCKNYDNDNIECVICYEQYLDKECREK